MIKRELTKRDIASQQKKRTIFQSAMGLFREYGYHQVTMKMIAKESGISEGSIYHFFGEKAGILSMLITEIQNIICHHIALTEENLNSPGKALLNYLYAQAQEYENLGRDLAGIFCMYSQKPLPHPIDRGQDLKSTIRFIDPVLTGFIQAAMDRGSLKAQVTAEELAFTLTTLGSGLTSIWVIYGEGYSLADEAYRVFQATIQAYLSDAMIAEKGKAGEHSTNCRKGE